MELISVFSHLGHWQIDILTIVILLTSAIFTLIPEELLFFSLGFLSHFGRLHPVEAIVAAQLGVIPADFLTVWIGRKLGKGILRRKPFCFLLGRESVDRSLKKLRKSGGGLLFFTRFTPMLRTPIYLAAGISGFSLKKSILIDGGAACIQIPLFFLLGFVLGEPARHFVTFFTYVMVCCGILVGLFEILKSVAQTRRNRANVANVTHNSVEPLILANESLALESKSSA